VGLPFVQDPYAAEIILGYPDRGGAEAEHGKSYNAEKYFRLSHPTLPSRLQNLRAYAEAQAPNCARLFFRIAHHSFRGCQSFVLF
jgi:hypothetical protein